MHDVEQTRPSFLNRLRDSGDGVNWSEFHARYGHMLYRYARSLGAAHADAEDVVQEVEMQLFQAMGGFVYDARRGRFRSYLRAAVLHALGRRATRKARQRTEHNPRKLEELVTEEDARRDEVWEMEWQMHELREAAQFIADEFDPVTWKAFEMHVLAGCAADDAASALEISKWSVYRARNRVLSRLRQKLAELSAAEDA
jgi:RNA polymerase sigma-70 factor (ECF subfamily)